MKVCHGNILDKRQKAATTSLDEKNSESKSSISLRNLKKEFNIPKTIIVRTTSAIRDGRPVGKRGRPEILKNGIVRKTLDWIDQKGETYRPPSFKQLQQFLSNNIYFNSKKLV